MKGLFMKRTNKKAFTIVELVIVIAIIAILAAVIISIFSGIVSKAERSKDMQLIRNMNTAVIADAQINGQHHTLYDAGRATEDAGYIIDRILLDEKNIGWDSVNDRFVYIEKDGKLTYVPGDKDITPLPSADERLFKVYKSKAEADADVIKVDGVDQNCSIYAGEGWTGGATVAVSNVGFDAGNQAISFVTYTGTATTSTDGKNVVIRTNGGKLTIDAPKDNVKHYGKISELNINAVDTASYHEYGSVLFAEIKTGRIVLESTSEVDNLYFTKSTEKSFAEIIVRVEIGAQEPEYGRDSVGTNLETDVLVCKLEESGSQDQYVWLTGNGTIEDSKVLISSDKNGSDKTPVTESSASKTVHQIANSKVNGEIVDGGMNVEQKEEVIASATAFNEGKGTNEDPYIVCDKETLAKVSAKGGVYKLKEDIALSDEDLLEEKAAYDANQFVAGLSNSIFDGNGHTISITSTSNNSDGLCLFGQLVNSTIKNLNIEVNGKNFTTVSYIPNENNSIFEKVIVSGNVEYTDSNLGLFVQYAMGRTYDFNLKFINCKSCAKIKVTGDASMYDAIFVGYTKNDNNNRNVVFEFINCSNEGSIIGGKVAMFIANPNSYCMHFIIGNCSNNGIIKSNNTSDSYNLNYYYANSSNNYTEFVVNDITYTGAAANNGWKPTIEDDTLIGGTGTALKSSDATLALILNDDKTFTITPASSNVSYYVVSVGTYVALKTSGSNRTYVSERIEADGPYTTTLKDLQFVDQQWVDAHPEAVATEIAGNVAYTLEGSTYYLIDDLGHNTLNGKAKSSQMISVVGYNADGVAICAFVLNG